eukprot:s1085_g14.t1
MASRAAALKSAKKKSSPTIKQPVKQYSVDELGHSLDEYIRKVGVEAALDLGCYQSLPATFAVRGAGLVKIQGLLRVLLAVTLGATLCFIGGILRADCLPVRFGQQWSDRFTVILGRIRRLQQPVRWNQAAQSMSDPDIRVLEGLVDLLEDELPAKKAKQPKPAAEPTSILKKPLETLQKPEKNFALVNGMQEDGLDNILPEQEEIPSNQGGLGSRVWRGFGEAYEEAGSQADEATRSCHFDYGELFQWQQASPKGSSIQGHICIGEGVVVPGREAKRAGAGMPQMHQLMQMQMRPPAMQQPMPAVQQPMMQPPPAQTTQAPHPPVQQYGYGMPQQPTPMTPPPMQAPGESSASDAATGEYSAASDATAGESAAADATANA